VTVEQSAEFVKVNPLNDRAVNDIYSPDPKGPINGVTWYEAAAYCNWLSRKENLPECYQPNERGHYAAGMKVRADALELTGYRLPTEAEWEYACRSGAATSRYYGSSVDLLGRYARYWQTSQGRAWPCGSLPPNDLGLSDMLGNEWEWCQDRYLPYRARGTPFIDTHVPLLSIYGYSLGVLRGGAFVEHAADVRSAERIPVPPEHRYAIYGFRLSRTYP
jgi:formylglycine-generating enzyme required for sulfatase activity